MITPATLIRNFWRARTGGKAGAGTDAGGATGAGARKPAFTLVEVVIASTIFTIVSLIGVTVFVNVTRIQRRISLENAIYEDGRFMMERLAREIRKSTIDYEEYYSHAVAANSDFGQEHGCYASRFYSPGSDDKLGVKCSIPEGDPKEHPDCVIDKTTLDTNTGQNPYDGIVPQAIPEDSTAMCDSKFANGTGVKCGVAATNYNDQRQLYLIDYKGSQKTIFALKTLSTTDIKGDSEHALSLVKINGEDPDNDGVNEKWEKLADGFDDKYPENTSLTDTLDASGPANGLLYIGFVPISPLRTNVVDLHFYVSPLEDPRKAFSTNEPADVQQQPHVTVVMTLQPAASELTNFAGNTPTITIQQTISSRVYNEVKSFRGEVCND